MQGRSKNFDWRKNDNAYQKKIQMADQKRERYKRMKQEEIRIEKERLRVRINPKMKKAKKKSNEISLAATAAIMIDTQRGVSKYAAQVYY